MENSSNALYIAGAVLIGIIVVSLFIAMFANAGNFAKSFEDEVSKSNIQKYNVQFENYENKAELVGADVVTLINLVRSYNDKAGENILDVKVDGQSYINKTEDKVQEDLLRILKGDNSKYKCTLERSNGVIKEIIIKKTK